MTSNTKLLLVYLDISFLLLFSVVNCQTALSYEHSAQSVKHLQAARMSVEKGQYEHAKSELEDALKQDPQSPDILNNLASVYLRLAQVNKGEGKNNDCLEKSRKYFTQALDNDPNFSPAWNGLADTYYLGGNTQQAISYYKKALSLTSNNSFESRTNLANAQRDLNLYAEAEANYKTAIKENPLYAPAHNGYAELLLDKHELDAAYSEITDAIRLKPDYTIAYYHLGLLESARNNKQAALKAYLLSLYYEKNSTYAQETQRLINKLGLDSNQVSYAELQKYKAELCPSHSSASPPPQSKVIPSNPAKSAKEDFVLNVPSVKLGIKNIETFIANKQWVKGNKEVCRFLKANPDDPVLLNELGVILLNQKNYSQAEKVLTEASNQSNHKLTATYYNLGQVYLAQQESAKAENALTNAKSLAQSQDEDTALIDNSLAILYRRQGKLEAAQSAYKQALKAPKNSYPVIHYNLALLLEQMNHKDEAADEFKAYINLSPHGLNANNAKKHLESIQ